MDGQSYCMIGFGLMNNKPYSIMSASLTYQLSKHFTYRVTCCPFGSEYGIPVFIRTNIIYGSEKSNASFGLQLGVPAMFINASYTRRFVEEESKLKVAVKYGNMVAAIECECEKRITKFSVLGASLSVGFPMGVMLKIRLVRGQQIFLVPIQLSEEILPASMLYGTVVPMVIYSAIKKFVVDPYIKKTQEENIEKKKEEMSERLSEKKKQAETAISLMKETVERIIENEEKRKGLIIVKALYGKLSSSDRDLPGYLCLDVTVPLQALVKDSKLILHDRNSMSELPGFYDPCPGEAKSLYIRYLFREKLHQVTLDDNKSVRIPVSKHVIDDDTDNTNLNT
ncbi:hypothetical protein KUTeg_001437 [Tegillarca granosa]|uniref:DnaJ-like protein C11 C-terminal domain-containing protein n=1 Tax=Tegillarca granosa TaxID=220873 RepID=A0ABQ9FRJ0_TEGGR|nr:hypothetical protein KUTeg_001437 [Tegillarca granosa]